MSGFCLGSWVQGVENEMEPTTLGFWDVEGLEFCGVSGLQQPYP